jgi:hypothetical protein
MQRRKKLMIRRILLVLILVVGPVHAQILFACAMMDTVVHDTCCCDEHEYSVNSDIENSLKVEYEPCCEVSVGLRIDTESVHKLIEVRSDVDPPPTMLVATDIRLSPVNVVTAAFSHAPVDTHHLGSKTYLLTQRLRI